MWLYCNYTLLLGWRETCDGVMSDIESPDTRGSQSDGKGIVSVPVEVRPRKGVCDSERKEMCQDQHWSYSEGKETMSGPTVVRPPKGGIPDSHEKVRKMVTRAESSVATSKTSTLTCNIARCTIIATAHAHSSGVAMILLKGVLKVNGQLAGHRGWGREGDLPPPAEGGSF